MNIQVGDIVKTDFYEKDKDLTRTVVAVEKYLGASESGCKVTSKDKHDRILSCDANWYAKGTTMKTLTEIAIECGAYVFNMYNHLGSDSNVRCQFIEEQLQSFVDAVNARDSEPVATLHINDYGEYRLEPADGFKIGKFYRNIDINLFTSPQPNQSAQLKDHEIRELVNKLKDVAINYHATQQLRAQISNAVMEALASKESIDG